MRDALQKKCLGFSVTEIVIGAAIIAVVVTGVATAWQFYLKLAGQSTRMTQADLLIEEAGEALQYIRDKGWDANIAPLALNTSYYLVWDGSDYVLTTTPTIINNAYTRIISLRSVNRDASSNISSSGTNDPGTRLATISIYPNSSTTTAPIVQAQTLIHDVFSN